MIGDPSEEDNLGAVYIYRTELHDGECIIRRHQVIRGSALGLTEARNFGITQALSGDGATLVVVTRISYHQPILLTFRQDAKGVFRAQRQRLGGSKIKDKHCLSRLTLSHKGDTLVLGWYFGSSNVTVHQQSTLGEWSEGRRLIGSVPRTVLALSISSSGLVLLTCGGYSDAHDRCFVYVRESTHEDFVEQRMHYDPPDATHCEKPPCLIYRFGFYAHLVGDASAFIVSASEHSPISDIFSGGGANVFRRSPSCDKAKTLPQP